MKYLLTTFTTIVAVGMFVTASPVLANGGHECVPDPKTEHLSRQMDREHALLLTSDSS